MNTRATYYSQDVTLGGTETVTSGYGRANRNFLCGMVVAALIAPKMAGWVP